jgi:NADH dehydrogenase
LTTVAVTGASGLVGGHLCRFFAARGFSVRALDRRVCELPDRIERASVAGADVLVHAAYPTREPDPQHARRINEQGTARLLALAREEGVARFVYVSSVQARADAPTVYGRTKHAAESMLDPERDLALRPGLVLAREGGGLFGRMRDMVARLPAIPVFGGGRQVLQTAHVDDLSLALLDALERRRTGVLTVAEREGPTYRELLVEIARRLGRKPVLVPVPFGPALLALRAVEALGLRLPVSSENLLGLRALRRVDVDVEARPFRASLDDVIRPRGGSRRPAR